LNVFVAIHLYYLILLGEVQPNIRRAFLGPLSSRRAILINISDIYLNNSNISTRSMSMTTTIVIAAAATTNNINWISFRWGYRC
jgi:hypothetical protein